MSATMHLVFKTHLDVGFTDFAAAVTQRYLEIYIPRAVRLAQDLREEASPDRFTWTTGSWIIWEYLERADPHQRHEAEEAIRAGDLRWHGLPFTVHSELLDPGLLRQGLGLSGKLDRRFGVKTIAAKMTDVPGHTRSIVPLLAEAGIRFLHIGVNPASAAPDVPPAFRWREPETGAELMIMYTTAGYGGVSVIDGLDHGLAFAHTGDNEGPPATRDEVAASFRALRDKLQGWTVQASTLDAFASRLETVRDRLPVVSEEIGDTWIHGTASDPWKMSRFRALSRLCSRWIADGSANGAAADAAIGAFSSALLLVPEHTWGLDAKMHLGDYRAFGRDAFHAARGIDTVFERTPREFSEYDVYRRYGGLQSYGKMEVSWREQRAYLQRAVASLRGTALEAEARTELERCEPRRQGAGRPLTADEIARGIELPRLRARFDPRNGSLVSLRDPVTGIDWASMDHPLFLYRYQSFSSADYDRFLRGYVANLERPEIRSWAVPDFGRPGMAPADSPSAFHEPVEARGRRDGNRVTFDLVLAAEPRERLGCPALVQLTYDFSPDRPCMDVELSWFDKPACRTPEASWLSVRPVLARAESWEMEKVGRWISPLAVVSRGGRNMHGVGIGIRASSGPNRLVVETADAHLVAPGRPRLLEFDDTLPDLDGGMHFCLHANVFGTNFPLWYEDDARFRFRLKLDGA